MVLLCGDMYGAVWWCGWHCVGGVAGRDTKPWELEQIGYDGFMLKVIVEYQNDKTDKYDFDLKFPRKGEPKRKRTQEYVSQLSFVVLMCCAVRRMPRARWPPSVLQCLFRGGSFHPTLTLFALCACTRVSVRLRQISNSNQSTTNLVKGSEPRARHRPSLITRRALGSPRSPRAAQACEFVTCTNTRVLATQGTACSLHALIYASWRTRELPEGVSSMLMLLRAPSLCLA